MEKNLGLDIRHAVAKAERRSAAGETIGGTGQTVLKRRLPPVAELIDRGMIGAEEVRSADEINDAFLCLAGGLLMRSASWERVDCSRMEKTHQRASEAVRRYQEWAGVWSMRKVEGNHMLEIVIAAVVDEQPFSNLAADYGHGKTKIRSAVTAGLRDYAARAGWVNHATGRHWQEQAAIVLECS